MPRVEFSPLRIPSKVAGSVACSAIRMAYGEHPPEEAGRPTPRDGTTFRTSPIFRISMLQAEEASETVRTDVTFVSNGLTPADHLHTPDDRAGLPRTDKALGEPSLVEHIVSDEADETTPSHLRQGHEHCRTARGAHLRSENEWVLRSVDQIGRYDSFVGIESLAPRPLVMIAGSESRHGPLQPNGRRTSRGTTGVVLDRRRLPFRPARQGRIRLPRPRRAHLVLR